MLYREQLLLLMYEALQAANTIAGSNLFAPGDWPTDPEQGAAIQVGRQVHEKKHSLTRGQPSFNTIAYITVDGRLVSNTGKEALAGIQKLADQIEQAILTSEPLNALIQQFADVESVQEVNSESGLQIAQIIIRFGMEFHESQEQFFMPVNPASVESIGVNVDLTNVFDATGRYVGSGSAKLFPQAITSPPRTSGPDGRNEGYIQFDNLQD